MQGIGTASIKKITVKDIPGGTGYGFLVKNWDITTTPPTDLDCIAVQGNDNPKSAFSDHAVVRIENSSKIYQHLIRINVFNINCGDRVNIGIDLEL